MFIYLIRLVLVMGIMWCDVLCFVVVGSIGLGVVMIVGVLFVFVVVLFKGNLKYFVVCWIFLQLLVVQFCMMVRDIGFVVIDLVGLEDWFMLKVYGVYSLMCNGVELGLIKGFVGCEFYDQLVECYMWYIDLVVDVGY